MPCGDGAVEGEGLVRAVRTGETLRQDTGKRFAADLAGGGGDGFEEILAGGAEVGHRGGREPDYTGGAAGRVKQIQRGAEQWPGPCHQAMSKGGNHGFQEG